ncbi:TetR/AcrR family transcriptional regulator [Kineococcus glutinatus]|uniref:TetR/AcrR family transcriptional regulator n=1 Tax=Kineococcus glutinatus TaxID=1070872 RepID=A0ABP9HPZ7_9ACTN
MPPAPELRADAARNRARVLDVARGRLAAGDTALPMNVLAGLAGVGVGTVYRHFPDRRALLEALAADSLDRLDAEARAAAVEPDPLAGLDRLLRSGVRLLVEDAALQEVFSGTDTSTPAAAARLAELTATCDELLQRARAAGVVREGVTVTDLRRLVCGLGHAARIGGPDPRAAEAYAGIVLAGLRAPS